MSMFWGGFCSKKRISFNIAVAWGLCTYRQKNEDTF